MSVLWRKLQLDELEPGSTHIGLISFGYICGAIYNLLLLIDRACSLKMIILWMRLFLRS